MRRSIAVLACAACSSSPGGGGEGGPQLQLIAGRLGGPGSVDGLGEAARFSAPGFATTANGTYYLSDGNAVRAIDELSGAVTTLAGVASNETIPPGSADGVGAAARFKGPAGLVVAGNTLFVADSGNHALRAIALDTQTVTTPALDAGVGQPVGLAVADDGTLYVADFGNENGPGNPLPSTGGSIRVVDPASGTVTILAGDPSASPMLVDGTGSAARFSRPRGIVYDGAGTLYVADDCALRTVAIASGEVTTVAGGPRCGWLDGIAGAARFGTMYGLAFDGTGGLLVVDGASVIRRVALGSWNVTTLAGMAGQPGLGDGELAYPTGIALGATGGALVTDSGSYTIRRVDLAAGTITTFAGSAFAPGFVDGIAEAASFANPTGIAFDGTDTLFVADHDNNAIRAIAMTTGEVTTLATGLKQPLHVAYDGRGALFVAEDLQLDLTSRIERIDLATHAVTTLATTSLVFGGLASDGTRLYASDSARGVIHAFDPASGADSSFAGVSQRVCVDSDGPAASATFCEPGELAFVAGQLYVAEHHAIRAIDIAAGQVSTVAHVDDSVGIASDLVGGLYVADAFHGVVRRIDAASGAAGVYVGRDGELGVVVGPLADARLNGPWAVAATPSGLVVSDVNENAILIVQ